MLDDLLAHIYFFMAFVFTSTLSGWPGNIWQKCEPANNNFALMTNFSTCNVRFSEVFQMFCVPCVDERGRFSEKSFDIFWLPQSVFFFICWACHAETLNGSSRKESKKTNIQLDCMVMSSIHHLLVSIPHVVVRWSDMREDSKNWKCQQSMREKK